MGVRYSIVYQEHVVDDHIPSLPVTMKKMIKRAIEERLMIDPISFGKPLRYSLKGHRRLRVNNYRVIYRIDYKKREVTVIAIKHRKDIYQQYLED